MINVYVVKEDMQMSYLKGKDIKVPFDCLWHCMTRSFQVTARNINGHNHILNIKPKEFDTW